MSSKKAAALDYARAGWPIFPCKGSQGETRPNGDADKSPFTPKGVHDATTNIAQIEKWWSDYPEANIGFHCGAAGFLVLDFDPGSDLQAVAEQYELPETQLVALTPRGGQHEYYTKPQGLHIAHSASKVAQHVDIRADASYVLLPPSHTIDGSYEWDEQGKPAPAPQNLLMAAAASARKPAVDPKAVNVPEDLPHNIAAYTEWLQTKARTATEGQGGNNALTATAAMGHSYALSSDTTLALCWDFYNPRCEPPWDDVEDFERTVASGHRSASSNQGNMTEDYKKLRLRQLSQAGNVFKNHAGDGEETEQAKPRFQIWTIPELNERTPPEWLLNEIVQEQGYSIIYGPSGAFKSFLALDMGLCIATGQAWNSYTAAKKGRVLYVMGEGTFDVHLRIKAWLQQHRQFILPTYNFQVMEPAALLKYHDDVAQFIETAAAHGPWDLVIADTIGRFMPGINDNLPDGARLFSEFVTLIRRELNAATLAITHAPKDDPTTLLGGGPYIADADSIFNATIIQRGQKIDFRNTKQKSIKEWDKSLGFEATTIQLPNSETSIILNPCEPSQRKQDPSTVFQNAEQSQNQIYLQTLYSVLEDHPRITWADAKGAMVTRLDPEADDLSQRKLKTSYDNWFNNRLPDDFAKAILTGDRAGKGKSGSPVLRLPKALEKLIQKYELNAKVEHVKDDNRMITE